MEVVRFGRNTAADEAWLLGHESAVLARPAYQALSLKSTPKIPTDDAD
jgi:hypothetical protein